MAFHYFPPYFIRSVVLACFLLLAIIGYWLLARRVYIISWVLFGAHFILSMPAFVFLTYPAVFLDMDQQNQTNIFSGISFRLKLFPLGGFYFAAALPDTGISLAFRSGSFMSLSKGNMGRWILLKGRCTISWSTPPGVSAITHPACIAYNSGTR